MGYSWTRGIVCSCEQTYLSKSFLLIYTSDRLRPLSYNETDVFVVVFSIVNPTTLDNVRAKWADECEHYCPNVPMILVGTKADLRDDKEALDMLRSKGESTITIDDGQTMATMIGAKGYMECSALTVTGVHEVFNEAIRIAIECKKGNKKKKRCTLL
eukprot:TRINITY_DN663_c0_g1_i2.p1 TRINITY_DN663_c0_g1~~TRINITY_DN663_c0_g1_i2.p1  ORF type:complete len:157 (-),score=24.23 TRINITY_DN663_c0_g1_i2:34-504(-)